MLHHHHESEQLTQDSVLVFLFLVFLDLDGPPGHGCALPGLGFMFLHGYRPPSQGYNPPSCGPSSFRMSTFILYGHGQSICGPAYLEESCPSCSRLMSFRTPVKDHRKRRRSPSLETPPQLDRSPRHSTSFYRTPPLLRDEERSSTDERIHWRKNRRHQKSKSSRMISIQLIFPSSLAG